MGCFDNMIKSLLFVFNFLCVLCGAAILGLGIWVTVKYDTFSKLNESSLSSPAAVMIAIGAVILLVAILGCIGACCDNRCMLLTYSILLLVLFVAQVAVGIIIIVNGKDWREPMHKLLQREFDNSFTDKASEDFYKSLQTELECCGVDGPKDYTLPGQSIMALYRTCCVNSPMVCVRPYSTGCATRITDFIEKNSTIFGGVAIGIAVVEILGAIAGFATANYIKRQY